MTDSSQFNLTTVYPVSLKKWKHTALPEIDPMAFPEWLATSDQIDDTERYLIDLAQLEKARHLAHNYQDTTNIETDQPSINPSLQLLQMSWQNLPELLNNDNAEPVQEDHILLIYKTEFEQDPVIETASPQDLLALKIIAEDMDIKDVVAATNSTLLDINTVLIQAANKSLIYLPETKLIRPDDFADIDWKDFESYRKTRYFTLQWHITQDCDMSCQHCYDRTLRNEVSLDEGLKILDQLEEFAEKNHVTCQVSFSGGNPLMHPHFYDLYQSAADRGFLVAILGNPMPAEAIQKLVDIQIPEFYQISIEGLETHNDMVRGKGTYQNALTFLEILQQHSIYSMVMLTLTNANMGQVIPLSDILKDKSDQFTFNRLSNVGQGAALASANIEKFRIFLEDYTKAAENNPTMAFKESFFNILRYEKGLPLLGGCTGFGCGAAFNFVSLLPDGEVHACRKFPSLIGNINQHSLEAIYQGDLAKKYRSGASECQNCKIRPACGGCLAVAQSSGRDPFSEKDPYCFYKD